MPDLVFVYGTLRKGEVNHHLLDSASFCGVHTTPARYKMLHFGAYPGVVSRGATAIRGEVYRIDYRCFKELDRLEDYPNLYTRKLIPTPWGRAWIYLYRGDRKGRASISSGDWRGQARQSGHFSLY